MNGDIDTLAKGVGLFSSSMAALKQFVDLIPNIARKQEAKEELERLEQAFKLTQAEAAEKLGYHICRRHWPPVIMLEGKPGEWTCPECGEKRNMVGGWVGMA